MSMSNRIRVHETRVLSDHYGTLTSTKFEWRRDDGSWQMQSRDVFDRGNAAAILPYNLAQRSVMMAGTSASVMSEITRRGAVSMSALRP